MSRPQYHLDLGGLPLFPNQNRSNTSTATSSPVDQSASVATRPAPQNELNGLGSMNNAGSGISRLGAGSPSHDYTGGSRFYPRRHVARVLLADPTPANNSIAARANSLQKARVAPCGAHRLRAAYLHHSARPFPNLPVTMIHFPTLEPQRRKATVPTYQVGVPVFEPVAALVQSHHNFLVLAPRARLLPLQRHLALHPRPAPSELHRRLYPAESADPTARPPRLADLLCSSPASVLGPCLNEPAC